MYKKPENINDLGNQPLSYLFTFFNTGELNKLTTVCKKWNRIILHEKFTSLKINANLRILDQAKAHQPTKYFRVSNARIEKSREMFLSKLTSLPYWFGDIDREEAIKILQEGEQIKKFLLRESSIKGCITLSMLTTPDAKSRQDAKINTNCIGAIVLPGNKRFVPSVSEQSATKKQKSELIVVHFNFVVFEDEDKNIKIKPNEMCEQSLLSCWETVEEFDIFCRARSWGVPVIRQEPCQENSLTL